MACVLDRRAWILLFLTAACGPHVDDAEEAEDFIADRDELQCDILLACGVFESEDECGFGSQQLGECERFDRRKADACIEALEGRLAALSPADQECSDDVVDLEACFGVIYWDETKNGNCQFESTAGRPIREAGEPILPDVLGDTGCLGRAGERWLHAARMEHASVAAFARLSMELMTLAAPASLVARAHRAALDELRHADMCLRVARQVTGDALDLGRMRTPGVRPRVTVDQLAVEALLEGCIGEGIAAAVALFAAETAPPEVAEVLRRIARDELRHAALAWSVIGWALEERPELGPVLFTAARRWALAQRERAVDPMPPLPDHGILGTEEEHRIATAVVEGTVLPTLAGLVSLPDLRTTTLS